jgi:hypothetical protein
MDIAHFWASGVAVGDSIVWKQIAAINSTKPRAVKKHRGLEQADGAFGTISTAAAADQWGTARGGPVACPLSPPHLDGAVRGMWPGPD